MQCWLWFSWASCPQLQLKSFGTTLRICLDWPRGGACDRKDTRVVCVPAIYPHYTACKGLERFISGFFRFSFWHNRWVLVLVGSRAVLLVCMIFQGHVSHVPSRAPRIPICTLGCGGRPAAAVLIRAQVSHSQHIRVKLQPLQNKLHGGLRAGSRGMCTVACFPNSNSRNLFHRIQHISYLVLL